MRPFVLCIIIFLYFVVLCSRGENAQKKTTPNNSVKKGGKNSGGCTHNNDHIPEGKNKTVGNPCVLVACAGGSTTVTNCSQVLLPKKEEDTKKTKINDRDENFLSAVNEAGLSLSRCRIQFEARIVCEKNIVGQLVFQTLSSRLLLQ
uniref:Putative secreted protein n=1 Tax=Amblyomma triste TaxID=251400 RepID=A0A023G2L9_AMBTT